MSSSNAVIPKPQLAFGWRSNTNADGFEQDHGRFTIEVYWKGSKRTWGVNIWGRVLVDGKYQMAVIREGSDPDLNSAKKIGLRLATTLEKEALSQL